MSTHLIDQAPAGLRDLPVEKPVEPLPAARGRRRGLRRLTASPSALAAGALLTLLVLSALAAPLWAEHVAGTTPYTNHITDRVEVGGEPRDVVSPDGVPIGPTWRGKFFLGADVNGRDIMVRLLYGGRNSLLIGVAATLLTALLAVATALVGGYFRGFVDAVLARVLDVIWAYPVILLGVALGTAFAVGGVRLGPIAVAGDSMAIPVLVIAVVYVPYMARPLRGTVLALREREFVEAARAQGAGPLRIMWSEILPNLLPGIVVLLPLMVANAILLEAALSFLGAGVRSPEPSWGTMIDDGVARIVSAEHLAIAPGLMLLLTVASLNVLGDRVREAIDPRARVRIER